jgi:hypothetical protein
MGILFAKEEFENLQDDDFDKIYDEPEKNKKFRAVCHALLFDSNSSEGADGCMRGHISIVFYAQGGQSVVIESVKQTVLELHYDTQERLPGRAGGIVMRSYPGGVVLLTPSVYRYQLKLYYRDDEILEATVIPSRSPVAATTTK